MTPVPGIGRQYAFDRDDAPLVRSKGSPPRLISCGSPDEFRVNEPALPLLFREHTQHPGPKFVQSFKQSQRGFDGNS